MSTENKSGWIITALAGLRDWTNDRLPIVAAWERHMSKYYAPKNFNFWYLPDECCSRIKRFTIRRKNRSGRC